LRFRVYGVRASRSVLDGDRRVGDTPA
jgi:hypothetical protein